MNRLIKVILLIASTGILMLTSAAGLTVTATSGIASKCTAVMWITNSANVLQQTFKIWDKGDSDHLKIWRAVSGNKLSVDAVSSATLASKATMSGTWNLKGADGTIVPNGTYKYWIEICQDGPTPYHAVGSIVIDGTSKTKAGVDSTTSAANISNVSADYSAPATGSVEPIFPLSTGNLMKVNVAIGKTSSVVTIPHEKSLVVSLYLCNGIKIWEGLINNNNSSAISIDGIGPGTYLLNFASKNYNISKKIIVGN